jgi:hypothetical protein
MAGRAEVLREGWNGVSFSIEQTAGQERTMVLEHEFQHTALVFIAGSLLGCQGPLPFTPLKDLYNLEVATTRDSYVAGDSVFVRITNNEGVPFVWHRCPGVLLERRTSSGWTELTSDDTCTPGSFEIPGGNSLVIVFAMPGTAPAGQYRAQVRLSLIDGRPPLFWFASREFTVTSP